MLVLLKFSTVWVNFGKIIPSSHLKMEIRLRELQILEAFSLFFLQVSNSHRELFSGVVIFLEPGCDIAINLIVLMLVIVNHSCIGKPETVNCKHKSSQCEKKCTKFPYVKTHVFTPLLFEF